LQVIKTNLLKAYINRKIFFSFTFFALLTSDLIGQEYGAGIPEKICDLRIYYNYTTDAKIYYFPNSSDYQLRNSFLPLNGITNFGAEFRYNASRYLDFAINLEYIHVTKTVENFTVIYMEHPEVVSVVDGFYLYPVELLLHYKLPFSSDKWKFSFGGGFGLYYGGQIRDVGNAEVVTIERKLGYSILVGFDLDYYFHQYLFLTAGMKFRDPEFRITSKYNKRMINYGGREVLIPQESFDSKINVDGICFRLGLGVSF